VRGLEVGAAAGSGVLRLHYALEADPLRVRVPPAGPGGRADRLWVHTCFEAFVRVEDAPGYLELNFSPSGQWAAYHFDAYRQGMTPPVLEESPRIVVRGAEHFSAVAASAETSGIDAGEGTGRGGARRALTLEALARLPVLAGAKGCRLHLGLCAVVEDDVGGLSYWALRHPAGRPDFHRPEAFALELTCL